MTYKRLDKAIVFAAKRHAGAERDGEAPLPYITHPVEVLLLLRTVGGVTDEDLLCAGVMHDLIEETATKLSEIEEVAGPRVRALVKELTRVEPGEEETKGLSKDEIWTLRANLLLDEIGKMSPDARQVKLADRLANVREAKRTKIGYKLDRYLAQSRRILEIVARDTNAPLWDAICAEL